MNRKIIFYAFLVLFLIGSICAVSSADITNDAIGSDQDMAEISAADLETHSASSEAINEVENSESDFQESEVLKNTVPEPCHPKVPEPGENYEEIPCSSFNSSIIVNKYWENNYSGEISSIEIQLLHKVNVQSACPPKWKSSPDDAIFDETIGTIVILPDANGELTSYTIVDTAIISKENNWRYVFKNLTFSSASLRETESGNRYWYLGDVGEYIIREINLQNNVEVISAVFVKNFTCPNDGGLKVFWNLTNRYVPPTNETNQTEQSNETVPVNETDEFKQFTDLAKGPESSSESGNDKTQDVAKQQEVSIDQNATGNPLSILLVMISVLLIPIFRRKGR